MSAPFWVPARRFTRLDRRSAGIPSKIRVSTVRCIPPLESCYCVQFHSTSLQHMFLNTMAIEFTAINTDIQPRSSLSNVLLTSLVKSQARRLGQEVRVQSWALPLVDPMSYKKCTMTGA
jgi:hypothetical protein